MKNRQMVVINKIFGAILMLALTVSPVFAAQVDVGIEYFAGKVAINNGLQPAAALEVASDAAGTTVAIFKGVGAAQTGDLTRWMDTAGNRVSFVDKDGSATFKALTSSSNVNAINYFATGNITASSATSFIAAQSNMGIGTLSPSSSIKLDIQSANASTAGINIKYAADTGAASPFTVVNAGNAAKVLLNPYASSANYLFDTQTSVVGTVFDIKNLGVPRLTVDNSKTTIANQLDVGAGGTGVIYAGALNNVVVTKPASGNATLTLGTGSTVMVSPAKSIVAHNNLIIGSSVAGTSTDITLLSTPFSTSGVLNIGPGGTLTSNAFSTTVFAPVASPTFTGMVTIPDLTLTDSSVNVPGVLANKMLATSADGVATWISVPSTPTTLTNVTSISSPSGTTIGDPATTTGKTTLADPLVITPPATFNLTASAASFTPTSSVVRIAGCTDTACGTGAAVVGASVATAGASDGQMLVIVGKMASTASVKFTRGAAIWLATPSVTIADGSTLTLVYETNRWVELNRSLNSGT